VSRKTDVNDAMWLAELLAHGLIRASFVPDTQTQEMRNLLRTRKQLVREQSSHVLRVQKTLEDANIKLDSVLTDLMGKSGRAMIEALIAGETNPVKLAALADRRAKASHEGSRACSKRSARLRRRKQTLRPYSPVEFWWWTTMRRTETFCPGACNVRVIPCFRLRTAPSRSPWSKKKPSISSCSI
jgi:Transposase